MEKRYKGFVIEQDEKNDVTIKSYGKMVFHGQFERQLSEIELYSIVDNFIKEKENNRENIDEILAEFLLKNRVIVEPAKLGEKLWYIQKFENSQKPMVRCGRYIGCSKGHVILTYTGLYQKPIDEQLEDIYINKSCLLVVVQNKDIYFSKEEAEKEIDK